MFTLPGRPLPQPYEISEARHRKFYKDFKSYEDRLAYEHTLDAIVNLYGQWKKVPNFELQVRIVLLMFEARRLNPRCDLDIKFFEEA